MATVAGTIKIMDQASRTFQRMTNQVLETTTRMERLKRVVESPIVLRMDASQATQQAERVEQPILKLALDNSGLEKQVNAAREFIESRLQNIKATIKVEMPENVRTAADHAEHLSTSMAQIADEQKVIGSQQSHVNHQMHGASQHAETWMDKLQGIASGYYLIQGILGGIKGLMDTSDEYINTRARLDLINDKMQTTAQLQDKIFASAERARGSYTDMAGIIGRMGILAGDAFKGGNDELIAFSELMQKSFRIGGTSTMEQQAGMYQLTQAMASGKLQGDEFRSITENAPMLAKAIANVTGKTIGELKQMSAEGGITAGIIIAAMFNAADEINSKFAGLPMTFGDVMNSLKKTALQSFGPIIKRINGMLNSAGGEEFIANLQSQIVYAATAVNDLLTAAVNVYNFISSNWPMIGPIVWGIVASLAAWKLANIAIGASSIFATLRMWALTAAVFFQMAATSGLAFAWAGLNATMKANVFILIISLIVGLIVWLVKLWKTNDDFAAGLMRAWNAILNFFDKVPIFFTRVGYGIADAFSYAKVQSLELIDGLVNGAIDRINSLIEKINRIPGVSLQMIDNVRIAGSAAAEEEAARQARAANIAEMEASAANKAAEREQKVQDMLKDRESKRAQEDAMKQEKMTNMTNPQSSYTPIPKGVATTVPNIGKVGEVGKVKGTVDISSEDLKVMRDIAEMKSIQNFVTLTPTVQVTTGDIRHEVDVNKMIEKIADVMERDIANSAQGVYS